MILRSSKTVVTTVVKNFTVLHRLPKLADTALCCWLREFFLGKRIAFNSITLTACREWQLREVFFCEALVEDIRCHFMRRPLSLLVEFILLCVGWVPQIIWAHHPWVIFFAQALIIVWCLGLLFFLFDCIQVSHPTHPFRFCFANTESDSFRIGSLIVVVLKVGLFLGLAAFHFAFCRFFIFDFRVRRQWACGITFFGFGWLY